MIALTSVDPVKYKEKIDKGANWLCKNQNNDGGWGDTDRSPSNYPATILSISALSFIDGKRYSKQIMGGKKFINKFGGFQAITDYYGDDKTFSVPIMTVAAMAGLISWKEVPVLPYEAVLFPRGFLRALRLPIVSYALPALCGIGMLGQNHNPQFGFKGFLRKKAEKKAFRILKDLQPGSGGYLEAAPITSFVASSLAHLGKRDHVVVRKAIEFLIKSQRKDGSWPIDENLSVWNTAIALQTLASCGINLTRQEFENTRNWYIQQQRGRNIYTESPPGGFPWTHLSGGVPDGDDTGMSLVVLRLFGFSLQDSQIEKAIYWCQKIQNRNGGWPTFCKGWGKLPFDRSSVDITAHILIGLIKSGVPEKSRMIRRGVDFLLKEQLNNGSWTSLWFGNELEKDKQNYIYATSQVIKALSLMKDTENVKRAIKNGMNWILKNQNSNGGWGPIKGIESSPEETAFALIGLLESGINPMDIRLKKGVSYLLDKQNLDGSWEPTPIGLYFAQLWYYEKIYADAFPLWALSFWMEKYNELRNNNKSKMDVTL